AVTIEQRDDQEVTVGYRASTGEQVWSYSHPVKFTEFMGGDGPRSTPTIYGSDVFSLGAKGHLACLDAATGKRKWSVEILGENKNLDWGMAGSPLVFDEQVGGHDKLDGSKFVGLVIVNPGTQQPSAEGTALVAYNRVTGEAVWRTGTTKAGYSSPM